MTPSRIVATMGLVIWLAWLPRLAPGSGTIEKSTRAADEQTGQRPTWITRLHDFNLRYGKVDLSRVNGSLSLRLKPPNWIITFERIKIARLSYSGMQPDSSQALEAIAVSGRIVLSQTTSAVERAQIDIHVPGLGTAHLSAAKRPAGQGLRVRYRARDLKPLRLPGVMARGLDDLAPGGRIDITGEVLANRDGTWETSGRMVIKKGQFHDPSYLYSAEGIHLVNRFRGRYDGQRWISGSWDITLDHGEMVLDRFYADFSKQPLQCSLKASADPLLNGLRIRELKIAYQSVLKARLAGTVHLKSDPIHFDIRLNLPRQPISPLLDTFIREPLIDQVSLLKTVQWSGSLESSLRLNGSPDHYRVTGMIDLDDGFFDLASSTTSLTSVHLHLPIDFSNRPKDSPSPRTKTQKDGGDGLLAVGAVHLPGVDIHSIRMPFRTTPNHYRSLNRLILPILGGEAELDRLTVELNPSQGFKAQGRIRIADIDLGSLFTPMLRTSLNGTLNSEPCRLSVTPKEIRIQGRLAIDLLSGQLVLDSIRFRRPFSLSRTLILNARWHDIDLEQLTRYTHFGLITGRLKGRVRNLQIGPGGPISFDLVLESEDEYRGKKRISVTAIDNLALVGSGQSPFVGSAALLTTFFRDFSYQKIGIECTLKNDYFSIHGLIRQGDTEYLVKHGGLSGVNVVNRTPGNRISWNDMIQRLERIQYTDKIKVTRGGKK